ncbi:MAG: hypothetical protein RLZZ511_2495 [Cyanobacteriota bacterium]|jgi:hypothetical protein
MNLRFAIACFLVLFGLAQFWNWLQQFSLEEPVMAVGGLLLACASNFNRRAAFPFDRLNTWLASRSPDHAESSATPPN